MWCETENTGEDLSAIQMHFFTYKSLISLKCQATKFYI